MGRAPSPCAAAADPLDDRYLYCEEGLDGGASGAWTDFEHSVLVGDPPLPGNLRQRTLTIDGVRTRVIEGGLPTAQEAVVFVHGHPGSARDYDGLMRAAAELDTRVVTFDMPGLGRAADGPSDRYSTDGAARFIDRALAKLGIRKAHLVVHDFGGPWGLTWAMRHNDRMPSVVLINTGVFIDYYGHPMALVWHTAPAGELHMATATRAQFHAYAQANNPRPLPGPFLDRMYDDWDRATRCAALGYYRSIDNPDAMGRRQAAALRKRPNRPALVIWGEGDTYVPVSLAKRQRQAFPRAEIHRIPNAGHWPFVDDPAKVRNLTIPFLRRVVRSPRLVVTTGRLRAGRTTPLRPLIRAEGVPAARAVRLRLLRRGHLKGATAKPVTIGPRARRVAIRLSEPLRAGRYSLRIISPDLPDRLVTLVVSSG